MTVLRILIIYFLGFLVTNSFVIYESQAFAQNSSAGSKDLNDSLQQLSVANSPRSFTNAVYSPNLSSNAENNETANNKISKGFVESMPLLFAQLIVTGLASGLAIVGANLLLDWHRRPFLSLDRGEFSRIVRIDLPLYTLNIPAFPRELSQLTAPYVVNRVVVKNSTNNAAENCKGVLRMNDIGEKLCWYVEKERNVMTINSHSEEYLDVCAILAEEPQLVFNRLEEIILQRFGSGIPGSEARTYVRSIYDTAGDIPIIIAPTENGWMDAHLNRRIQSGDATLLVTSKNARRTLRQDIRILQIPNAEEKILEWR